MPAGYGLCLVLTTVKMGDRRRRQLYRVVFNAFYAVLFSGHTVQNETVSFEEILFRPPAAEEER